MFILDTSSGCGWIPDATINFIANIVDIIKVFVPILLIIMGAIDFGKAVMAQQEDQIKKSQSAFIQKVIAGAAVFFVITLVGWLLEIIDKADSSLNARNAITCFGLMLNGGYKADNIDQINISTTTNNPSQTTTTTVDYNQFDLEECENACEQVAQDSAQITILTQHLSPVMLPSLKKGIKENCISEKCYKINQAMVSTFPTLLQQQLEETEKCKTNINCTSIENCTECLENNEVEIYKYLKNTKSIEICNETNYFVNDSDKFQQACMNDFGNDPKDEKFNLWDLGPTPTDKKCMSFYNIGSLTTSGKEKCCENLETSVKKEYEVCVANITDTAKTNLVKWYCELHPDEC